MTIDANIVTVSLEEYLELVEARDILNALYAAGVDSTGVYEVAMDIIRENKENDDEG